MQDRGSGTSLQEARRSVNVIVLQQLVANFVNI